MSAMAKTVVEKAEQFLDSHNPADGSVVGSARVSSRDEVFKAVADAREAHDLWRRISFSERRRIVMRARQAIIQETEEIARLISKEMGKPVAEAISMEIAPVLDLMQYFAKNSKKLLKPKRRGIGLLALFGRSSTIVNKPLGVIGIISPWNFPFSIPLGEVVMAIMAGNSVVLKPSELTPLTGLKIAEIFETAQLPKNVLHVVSGGGDVGAALVDARPDKVMFTGSVATGRKIAAKAGENLTPVVLELGSKDPMVVFKDADLDKASSAAVWGAFSNAGQACASVERLFVEEDVYERFLELLVEKTDALKLGVGTDPENDLGAMSSARQKEIVEGHVAAFRESGAEILTGGESDDSNFYPPTVISGADNSMVPMREETFGPTLPVASFETEDEAVDLANDTEFGLTASVWTKDIKRGRRVAEKIVAGTVMVNEVVYTHGIGQTPWGGFKNSGFGRTHGVEGLMEMVATQHIHVNRFYFLPDIWWFGYSESALESFKEMTRTYSTGSLLRTIPFMPRMLKRLRELMK
ncbi:MAG: aldehyde dehydrogenase family protein [Pyrinomonadaceae bacterium]